MYQLLMAVLAITLTSLALAGGVQYLHSDRSFSTETSVRIVTSYRAIEMAFSDYTMANGGALPDLPSQSDPQDPSASWRDQISPYAAGGVVAPTNLAWSYGSGAQGAYVCVSNAEGAQVSSAMLDGMRRATGLVGPGARLSRSCGSTDQVDAQGGLAAVTFDLNGGR